ncbi:MAG: hypothetical protein OSW77_08200, partial [Proteobacteria bacterium]|nr:hypothetical protein [Pseudomonadota bacterium]
MKIVHTEASCGWGGQEIRILEEARGLAARGHDVQLLCPPEARIFAWDMTQPGILNITVRGGERFRILSSEADRTGLLQARIEPVAAEPQLPVPGKLAALVP